MKKQRNLILAKNKQLGVTLITSLILLIVMTIVGVSAVKMSSIDILIAGNDQEKMKLYQKKESNLLGLTTVLKLYEPLVESKFEAKNNNTYSVPQKDAADYSIETIKDMKLQYLCRGVGALATSIGPSTPPCRLYDFKIVQKPEYGNAREVGHRGAGKEIPNSNTNNAINQ